MARAAAAAAAAAVACLLLALASSAAGAGKSSHHSPAPAPAVDCVAAATGLSDCLSYVSPGSADKSPSKTCCAEVKTAVASPAVVDCLCSFASDKSLGLPIDMKRVFKLPGACGSSNTVFDKCHISAGSPTEAPGSSAGGSSGGATASPPKAAASSRMTATTLVAAVAAPLLAYCYLF